MLAVLALPALAHGIDLHHLPLGDGKISHAPKVGWIWACHVNPMGRGADRDGPWIDKAHGTFDITAKVAVRGSVTWPHRFRITRQGDKRVFSFNDFPNHPTGQFPIARNDPAYRFDRNPNSIRRQNFDIALPAHPRLSARAHCAPNIVGIMLSGVLVFNALDDPGRDAVAHETQDRCHGHPQRGGVYHYHNLSNCIADKPDAHGNSRLVGYALDGFGIYWPLLARPRAHQRRSRRLPWHDQRDRLGWPHGEDVSLRGDRGFSLHCRLPARRLRPLDHAPHRRSAARSTWRSRSTRSRFLRASARPAGIWAAALRRPAAALNYFPRGALTSRTMIQIGMTITAPSRK